MVPLLKRNVELNGSSASAVPHHWGEAHPHIRGRFEVVIMADVVYDPKRYSPLVKSLISLTEPTTTVFWAHRSRNPDDALFMEEAQKHFDITSVEWATKGVSKEAICSRCCDDVILYRMRKKSNV